MVRRAGVLAGLATLTLVAYLDGCGSARPAPELVVVFAAASLKPAFSRIAEQFKTDNPATLVDFDFAGSSELATQLTQGAVADVFASADIAQMDAIANAGLIAGAPVNFASNTLVIVTAPGNPKKVGSFAELTKPGLKVVVCGRPAPCGAATQRIENNTKVRLDPVSEEPNVSDVLGKVTSGAADAGLVYATDAANAAALVATVAFPEAARAVNVYPIAVLKKAPHPGLAQKFVDRVTGATGRGILGQAGFGKP